MKLSMAMLATGVILLGGATTASAQLLPWEDRGFVNISGAMQSRSLVDSATFSFTLYEESGNAALSREVKGGGFLDIMAGARLWKNIGIAFQFNTRKSPADAAATGSVPDPISFDANRAVTATIAGLVHNERWMAILPVFMVPISDKLEMMVFGGAAVVKLDHETVDAVTITEPAPTMNFTRTLHSRSVWGFSAGADLRYMFTKMIGAGVFARTQSATVNYPGTSLRFETGGPQFGVGVRVKF